MNIKLTVKARKSKKAKRLKKPREWDYTYSSTLKRESVSSNRTIEQNIGLKNLLMLIYGNLIIKQVGVAEQGVKKELFNK